jgi:hypothetical protein
MQVLTVPPVYISGSFSNEPQEPFGYVGTHFDFYKVAELIEPGDDESMIVLGNRIAAVNIQLETPSQDPFYPVYFETTGLIYHYVVSAWADRVVIEVCDLRTYALLSAMFPETEEQLRCALETLVSDCAH